MGKRHFHQNGVWSNVMFGRYDVWLTTFDLKLELHQNSSNFRLKGNSGLFRSKASEMVREIILEFFLEISYLTSFRPNFILDGNWHGPKVVCDQKSYR